MSRHSNLVLLTGKKKFNPAQLGPLIWFDPSDRSTLFQDSAHTIAVAADGDPIGAMRNKGSAGGYWIQTTAGERPLYKTSGGLSWLLWDGVDDHLEGTNSSVQTIGMAAGVGPSSPALGAWLADGGFDSSVRIDSDTNWRGAGGGNSNANDFSNGGSQFINGVAGSTFVNNVNHVLRSVATANRSTGAQFGRDGIAARSALGRLYGAVLISGTITSTQATNLDKWLGAKAGLSL